MVIVTSDDTISDLARYKMPSGKNIRKKPSGMEPSAREGERNQTPICLPNAKTFLISSTCLSIDPGHQHLGNLACDIKQHLKLPIWWREREQLLCGVQHFFLLHWLPTLCLIPTESQSPPIGEVSSVIHLSNHLRRRHLGVSVKPPSGSEREWAGGGRLTTHFHSCGQQDPKPPDTDTHVPKSAV